jgi:hypothetical protein
MVTCRGHEERGGGMRACLWDSIRARCGLHADITAAPFANGILLPSTLSMRAISGGLVGRKAEGAIRPSARAFYRYCHLALQWYWRILRTFSLVLQYIISCGTFAWWRMAKPQRTSSFLPILTTLKSITTQSLQ